MSLYQLQKVLYELNRDERVQARFREDVEGVLAEYDLTDEEGERESLGPFVEFSVRGCGGGGGGEGLDRSEGGLGGSFTTFGIFFQTSVWRSA